MIENIKSISMIDSEKQYHANHKLIEEVHKAVDSLNSTDKQLYTNIISNPIFFKRFYSNTMFTSWFWLIFNSILYLSYCIVHFKEIKSLNCQINQEGKDLIYFSIIKTLLSINIFIIVLTRVEKEFYRIICLVINLFLNQVIRFVLFKKMTNFFIEDDMITQFSVLKITIACLILSIIYLIQRIYSIYYSENIKNEEIDFSLRIIGIINNYEWINFILKLFYIQFFIFYFLTMRNFYERFHLYEYQFDFNLFFYFSIAFTIFESIEILFFHANCKYQICFEKFNLILRLPTLILSTSQFIYYIYPKIKYHDAEFRDIDMLFVYVLSMHIINISQFALYFLSKHSTLMDISNENIDESQRKNFENLNNVSIKGIKAADEKNGNNLYPTTHFRYNNKYIAIENLLNTTTEVYGVNEEVSVYRSNSLDDSNSHLIHIFKKSKLKDPQTEIKGDLLGIFKFVIINGKLDHVDYLYRVGFELKFLFEQFGIISSSSTKGICILHDIYTQKGDFSEEEQNIAFEIFEFFKKKKFLSGNVYSNQQQHQNEGLKITD